MAVLSDKNVDIARTAVLGGDEAAAYGNPVRRRIVRALYRRTMTTAEIVAMLDGEGSKVVRSTVCYHIDMLQRAGIIDTARINTVRGTIEKHYAACTKLLEYVAPEDFEEAYPSEIASAARKMERVLGQLAPRVANRIPKGSGDPDYEQFILTEIINRAMTRVFESRAAGGRGAAASRRGGGAAR